MHPPQGGQGLNLGRARRGELGMEAGSGRRRGFARANPRHPPRRAASGRCPRVAQHDGASCAQGPDDRHQALRDTVTELLSMDEPRRRFAAMVAGLGIHYDLGDGHPLLGRRMRDLDLHSAHGPPPRVRTPARRPAPAPRPRWTRQLRHHSVGAPSSACRRQPRRRVGDPGPRRDRGSPCSADPAEGRVAWVGHLTDPELTRALDIWFGHPT